MDIFCPRELPDKKKCSDIMKYQKKPIYSNAINLGGLISKNPMKLKWDTTLNSYYDESGDYSVENLGLIEKSGIIIFSSENKKEVELWTNGIEATFQMLRNWLK